MKSSGKNMLSLDALKKWPFGDLAWKRGLFKILNLRFWEYMLIFIKSQYSIYRGCRSYVLLLKKICEGGLSRGKIDPGLFSFPISC